MAGASDRARRGALLAAFVESVRPPLDYLASAAPAAAARTHLPGEQLAAKGREVASALAEGAARRTLEELCAALVAYEGTAAAARPALVARCQALLVRLADGAAEPPAAALPPYRRSGGDIAATLAELGGSVQFVSGVGPRRAAELRKFGIETLEDLLYHLPFRYEDRRRVTTIAAAVVGEEAGGLAEIVAQRLHAEDFAGFVFDGLGRGAALLATPDDFDDLADAALDVQRMIRVIHEDAVPRDADGIRGGHVLRAGGQALRVLQLAGRTDRQRRKRVGQLRREVLARRIPDVPPAKYHPCDI